MKQSIPLKSTTRQPVRTLLLISLIALISFLFIGKAVEYIVVKKETDRIGAYYRSIGTLTRVNSPAESTNPEDYDVTEGINYLKTLPHVGAIDIRRSTSGIMDGVLNTVFGSDDWIILAEEEWTTGTHLNDFWFYGTLTNVRAIEKPKGISAPMLGLTLTFQVDTVVEGYPEFVQPGKEVGLLWLRREQMLGKSMIGQMEIGSRYFILGQSDFSVINQLDIPWNSPDYKVAAKIQTLDSQNLWYIPVGVDEEVDFSKPEYAAIKERIVILHENLRTLFLIATSDMSAIPEMQEESKLFFLVEGRWLNRQDEQQEPCNIVIQNDFAKVRGLKIGDQLRLTLRGLKGSSYEGFIQEGVDPNWAQYATQQQSFEIVGLYDDLTGLTHNEPNIYTTHAYITNSCLPTAQESGSGSAIHSSEFSFVLDDSRNQIDFVNSYKSQFANLGYELNFIDNNGSKFWELVNPLRQTTLAGLLVFGLMLTVASGVVIFVYLLQRKKDYAILRALGVSKSASNIQLFFPLAIIAGFGVVIGGLLSWNYALKEAANTISKLPTPAGLVGSAELPLTYLALFCLFIFVILIIFAIIGILLLSRASVLELLQGSSQKRNPKTSKHEYTETNILVVSDPNVSDYPRELDTKDRIAPVQERPGAETNSLLVAIFHFARKTVSRTAFRSLLVTLVASGFLLAIGWINQTIRKTEVEINRMLTTTVIEADIQQSNPSLRASGTYGDIYKKTVTQILDLGFVSDSAMSAPSRSYLFASMKNPAAIEFQEVKFNTMGINNPEYFFEGKYDSIEIEYATGLDQRIFTSSWTAEDIQNSKPAPAVFPEYLIDKLGLQIREKVLMGDPRGTIKYYFVAGLYRGWRGDEESSPILLPLSFMEIAESEMLNYDSVHLVLDPEQNENLNVFRDEVESILSGEGAGLVPLRLVLHDEQLQHVIAPLEKNLSLLKILYPATIAVSFLIVLGLCFLMVQQTAKESALLRTLGISETHIRIMLTAIFTILSFLGLVIGLLSMVALRWQLNSIFSSSLLLAAGIYLLGVLAGAFGGAVFITNKKPLELLQVKE